MTAATEDRSDAVERRVVDALRATGAPFRLLECDPDFADTAAFCERYGIDPAISANAIVVASKKEPKRYALCLVLATTRLDVNGVVRRRLEVNKASFASADETMELTGMMIGGVTPFGQSPDLLIWIDGAVMALPEVVVGGGTRSMKVMVDTSAFTKLANIDVVDGLARPITGD